MLRHCCSKVLIIVFSATFVLNVLSYIEESFYLHIPTRFYKQLLDCPNITQIVNTITKPGFEDLDFLISKVRLIFKTIVFVDKIANVIALAACFGSLPSPEKRH